MRSTLRLFLLAFALGVLAGCASTKVTDQTPMSDAALPRPNMIWVYDFVASPANVPPESSLNGQFDPNSPPPSAEDAANAQKYGAVIAEKLVEDIQQMGMPATNAVMSSQPQVGDAVLRGYIVSTEGGGAGNLAKRMIIGLGSGNAEMSTVVEGYAVTPSGLKLIGSGSVDSSGNKTPGLFLPAAIAVATANPVGLIVMGGLKIAGAASGRSGLEGRAKATADEIAAQLKVRFQKRGWIPADS